MREDFSTVERQAAEGVTIGHDHVVVASLTRKQKRRGAVVERRPASRIQFNETSVERKSPDTISEKDHEHLAFTRADRDASSWELTHDGQGVH